MDGPIKDCCQKEIEWYGEKGLFQERIVKDMRGNDYVIGDFSWSRLNQRAEMIEKRMRSDGVYL